MKSESPESCRKQGDLSRTSETAPSDVDRAKRKRKKRTRKIFGLFHLLNKKRVIDFHLTDLQQKSSITEVNHSSKMTVSQKWCTCRIINTLKYFLYFLLFNCARFIWYLIFFQQINSKKFYFSYAKLLTACKNTFYAGPKSKLMII